MDEQIQRAIHLGEANREIIELLRNWCSQLVVERSEFFGVGLLEVETGLPIGGRRIRCPHASNRGWEGSNLENLALQFYDRNCAACDKRDPVRLPNLSKLLGERDRQRAVQERQCHDQQAEEARRLAARKAHRTVLRQTSAETSQLAVLDALEAFDAEPTAGRGDHLKEVAKAAGKLCAEMEALFIELSESGGYSYGIGLIDPHHAATRSASAA